MRLDCYRLHAGAPKLVPASPERGWMDATHDHFAYRCTPLTMANATGWELLCPSDVAITWKGGRRVDDVVVEPDGDGDHHRSWVQSHFGHGIVTFIPGYLFRTDPEWALWCRGSPNKTKVGLSPLEGLIETDWLPFTFTMNWRFTTPATRTFSKGEPFCFLLPLPHMRIATIQPRVQPISAEPDLQAEYQAWRRSRDEFNGRIASKDEATLRQRWQRFYLKGQPPKGRTAPDTHRVKRRMLEPLDDSAEAHRPSPTDQF